MIPESMTVRYDNPADQLRVEARVAAALTLALRGKIANELTHEKIPGWLNQWESRFLKSLSSLPSRECDLATATFACRALLRNRVFVTS
jgi:hypothetical protein